MVLVLLEVVVVVSLALELEALLVAVVDVKSKLLPSTFTFVAGAFPNLKVTLVAELGNVNACVVELDKVPCQTVAPLAVTESQALPVADKLIFGLEVAFFISQVEPDVVALNCLKLAVFFDEDFLEEDFLLELLDFTLLLLLPDTLTELLSTLFLVEEPPLREAATQIPINTTKTTTTMPTIGIIRRNFT